MPADSEPLKRGARLAAPALRRDVEAAVRRRLRGDEAEDVVQATFTDVLSAEQVPEDSEEFRRFVFGVARNKVFDHFRRRRFELSEDRGSEPSEPEAPLSARDILRWAEGKLPDSESKHTLEWMLREGDGEKLEHIARDANLPAPRVRQRVSRLRKFLRERWAAELTLAGLGLLVFAFAALYFYAERRRPEDVVEREPVRRLPSAAPLAPKPEIAPEGSKPAGSEPTPRAPVPSVVPAPTTLLPTPSAVPRSSAVPVKTLARPPRAPGKLPKRADSSIDSK